MMEDKDKILDQVNLISEDDNAAESQSTFMESQNSQNLPDELPGEVINETDSDTIANEDELSEPNNVDNIDEASINEDADYEALRSEAKWYVLHTFSGYENVAKENLEIVIEKFNLSKRIFDIVIPVEDVIEEKNGKKKVVTRKVMPSYILVKMIYGDDIWHAVTRTRGITGFVGPKGRPLHLTEDEIRKMHLEKITVIDINILPNDKVEVLYGPLSGFIGTVLTIDVASEKCRVLVEMFGRDTPVDLSLTQIKKIN